MDRILASRMGSKAVELLLASESNKMVGYVNNKLVTCDISEALSKEKQVEKDVYKLANILSM